MPRIRTIKPEFWTSEQVVACSMPARLLFLGMWNFCDDGGVHPASLRRIKMEVFPADGMPDEEIRQLIDELRRVGLILEYEAQGARFWHVTGWQHQKIQKPHMRYPPPPQEKLHSQNSETIPIPVEDRSYTSNPRKGMEGKGREGITQEVESSSCTEPDKPASEQYASLPAFPCVGPVGQWRLPTSKLSEWQEAFPAVDVLGEARKALQWTRDHPEKRKTAKGMVRFLNRWLCKANDERRGEPRQSTGPRLPTREEQEGWTP